MGSKVKGAIVTITDQNKLQEALISLKEGVEVSALAIDDGGARKALTNLVDVSNRDAE